MKKWQAWAVIAAVFISGIIIGSVGTRLYYKQRVGGIFHSGGIETTKAIMEKLNAELSLTGQQREDIAKIVEETQHNLRKLRAQYRPQMEEIMNEGIASMKPLLSAEQQKRLDDYYARLKKRWDMRREKR